MNIYAAVPMNGQRGILPLKRVNKVAVGLEKGAMRAYISLRSGFGCLMLAMPSTIHSLPP